MANDKHKKHWTTVLQDIWYNALCGLCNDRGLVFLGKYSHGKWFDMEWNCYRFGTTHWMPLPEPPKEDDYAQRN